MCIDILQLPLAVCRLELTNLFHSKLLICHGENDIKWLHEYGISTVASTVFDTYIAAKVLFIHISPTASKHSRLNTL